LRDEYLANTTLLRFVRTGDRYWLEMDVNGELVAADVRKDFGDYFCLYPEYYNGSRFIFILAAAQLGDTTWLKCLLDNIQHLSNYFNHTSVRFGLSMAYYYEDENLEHLWKMMNMIKANYTFPVALRFFNGKFSRAAGLHVASYHPFIRPSDIIIMSDLHLDIPVEFVLEGIKHTVRNDQFYGPIVLRLKEHYDLEDWIQPNQTLQVNGFGILGCYADDFYAVGGMQSSKMDKTTWGGEDWYFVDKLARKGYRMARLAPERYVHYWHTRNIGTGWYIPPKKSKKKSTTTGHSSF